VGLRCDCPGLMAPVQIRSTLQWVGLGLGAELMSMWREDARVPMSAGPAQGVPGPGAAEGWCFAGALTAHGRLNCAWLAGAMAQAGPCTLSGVRLIDVCHFTENL